MILSKLSKKKKNYNYLIKSNSCFDIDNNKEQIWKRKKL